MEGAPSVAAGQPKPFLSKLYKMVDEEETNHIVAWTQAGDALIVLDPEAFAQQLLPLHFKHNNFSSFVRQLNTYGFSKVDPDAWIFAHLHFRRGAYDELTQIQRKSSHRTTSHPKAGGMVDGDDSLALMPLEGRHSGGCGAGGSTMGPQEAAMRAELESIRSYHTNMATRIRELSSQLQATREQQANTRSSVGKILTFLSQVYHASTQSGIAPTGLLANIAPITENKFSDGLVPFNPNPDLPPLLEAAPSRPVKRARIEDADPWIPDGIGETDLDDLVPSAHAAAPPMLRPQRSLGAEAARALPENMQEAALDIAGSTQLQDEVLKRMQSDSNINVDNMDADDLENFLWDFLETNQEQVEKREAQGLQGAAS